MAQPRNIDRSSRYSDTLFTSARGKDRYRVDRYHVYSLNGRIFSSQIRNRSKRFASNDRNADFSASEMNVRVTISIEISTARAG